MNVTVLGTGAIGSGATRALLREGFAVTAWNRTAARAVPLADDGARVEPDLATAARDAAVVLLTVFDTEAVRDVLAGVDGVDGTLAPEAVVLLCATVGLDVDDLARDARRRGIRLVDAPVLGNAGPAEAGALSVMAAGDPTARVVVEPVLDAMAARVTWVGDVPGPANRLKLACNTWVYGLNASMAQVVALASGLGVDPRALVGVLAGTAADSPYLAAKVAVMVGDDDAVVSPVNAIRKDLGLIAGAAAAAGMPTDLLDAADTVYRRATDHGHGDEDMARVVSVLAAA